MPGLGRITLAVFLWLVAACQAVGQASTGSVLGGVVVTQDRDGTRLHLTFSRTPTFDVFLLDEPNRVIIDLGGVTAPVTRPAVTPHGVVSGMRLVAPEQNRLRLVIDLAQAARLVEARFTRRARRPQGDLVLHLQPISQEAFRELVRPWSSSAQRTPPSGRPPAAQGQVAGRVVQTASRTGRPVRPPPKPVIVLDPGHGGQDPGAIAPSGLQEKDVVLAVARDIRRLLEASGRVRVVMTRNSDEFLRLRERVTIARQARATLFLSIHADSMPRPEVRGLSLYTLSDTASDAEAAALAQRENQSDRVAGLNLANERAEVASILVDLVQRDTRNRSVLLAETLLAELGQEVALLPERPHRMAGFAVLRAPDVPSVLVELGYLTNREDELLLGQSRHRMRLARGIVRAIERYLEETTPNAVSEAPVPPPPPRRPRL